MRWNAYTGTNIDNLSHFRRWWSFFFGWLFIGSSLSREREQQQQIKKIITGLVLFLFCFVSALVIFFSFFAVFLPSFYLLGFRLKTKKRMGTGAAVEEEKKTERNRNMKKKTHTHTQKKENEGNKNENQRFLISFHSQWTRVTDDDFLIWLDLGRRKAADQRTRPSSNEMKRVLIKKNSNINSESGLGH